MTTSTLPPSNVVSREEWLAARKALLAKERAMPHALDALARRAPRLLPWVKVEEPYVFEGPQGKCTLADLFRGRSQLPVYHFMLAPGSDRICHGCSFIADNIDAARQHFEHADQGQRGYARRQHLCPKRERRRLPHLLDLPPRGRAADGRLHVARPRAQGSQRGRRHHEPGEAA